MTSESEIKSGIAQRNSIRAEANLPVLDADRELEKLMAERAERIFEAVFASERARFSHAWRNKQDWFSGYGEWSRARAQIRQELRMGHHIDVVLGEWGYRLVDDDPSNGRKTYLSDENADRKYLNDMQTTLTKYGWVRDEHHLRCIGCAATASRSTR